MAKEIANYDEDSIKSLDWKEHIRMRPGMYIGKLGDGSAFDDGIYVLIKEVMDNSIDEFMMGAGKRINVAVKINLNYQIMLTRRNLLKIDWFKWCWNKSG